MPEKIDMLKILEDFPKQCKEAARLGNEIRFEGKIKNIIIAGMGGSGIAGDFLRSYLANIGIEAVFVVKDYSLPNFVREDTLAFIISYSGNTEETISAYRDALKKRAKTVVITSGGKLREICRQGSREVILIPKGIPPRTALGYLFLPMLNVLKNANLIKDPIEDIEDAISLLRNDAEFKEKAQELAKKLVSKIPIIYSSKRLAPAALSWKTGFNENSETIAFYNTFPELNHNEIEGYLQAPNTFTIIISDNEDYSKIRKQMQVTKKLIIKKGCPVLEVKVTGTNLLTKLLSTVYLGEFTSYYLAVETKKEAFVMPTPLLDEFKKEMAK